MSSDLLAFFFFFFCLLFLLSFCFLSSGGAVAGVACSGFVSCDCGKDESSVFVASTSFDGDDDAEVAVDEEVVGCDEACSLCLLLSLWSSVV